MAKSDRKHALHNNKRGWVKEHIHHQRVNVAESRQYLSQAPHLGLLCIMHYARLLTPASAPSTTAITTINCMCAQGLGFSSQDHCSSSTLTTSAMVTHIITSLPLIAFTCSSLSSAVSLSPFCHHPHRDWVHPVVRSPNSAMFPASDPRQGSLMHRAKPQSTMSLCL